MRYIFRFLFIVIGFPLLFVPLSICYAGFGIFTLMSGIIFIDGLLGWLVGSRDDCVELMTVGVYAFTLPIWVHIPLWYNFMLTGTLKIGEEF